MMPEIIAANPLVSARAERVGSFAGQDDHADRRVFPCSLERAGDLDQRFRAERIAHLGARDRDLRNSLRIPGAGLVAYVVVGCR